MDGPARILDHVVHEMIANEVHLDAKRDVLMNDQISPAAKP